jgi:hypothetical protein
MNIKNITISLGRTINLGNFEFVRMDVSIESEVNHDTYDEEFENLKLIVTEKLYQLIADPSISGHLPKGEN